MSKRKAKKEYRKILKGVPTIYEGGMVVGTTKYVAGKGASPILTKLAVV